MDELQEVYVCVRCLIPAGEGGTCPHCGGKRVGCRPGSVDDPCRQPLMDKRGQVRTRAPIWWLDKTVPDLIRRIGKGK